MTTVYFLRHGETDYNKKAYMQGKIDIPLNENGLRQAKTAADYFKNEGIIFDRVYSSPLKRAVKTAVCVSGFDEESIIIDDRLEEMGFGVMEGKYYYDLPSMYRAFIEDPPAYEPPEGAESIQHVLDRCKDFLGFLASIEEDVNVLAATHGGMMRGFISSIEKLPIEKFWVKGIENCFCLKVIVEEGKCSIASAIHTIPDQYHKMHMIDKDNPQHNTIENILMKRNS